MEEYGVDKCFRQKTSLNGDINDNGTATERSDNNSQNDDDDESKWTLYSASDHSTKFDAAQYLDGFYSTAHQDFAMQTLLFFLPGIIYWLPQEIHTLLDLGAGPTIYVPLIFRHRSKHMYSSDYAQINRDMLRDWILNKCSFNWINICEHIASIESTSQSAYEMQQQARNKMRAVLKVDVHSDEVIQGVSFRVNNNESVPEQFQVVVSNFCLEYTCETFDGYREAVRGAVSLIEPNGYLIQGGVLNAKEYSFGRRRFKCHSLSKQQLVHALKENGMETKNGEGFKLIIHDDVFVVLSRKRDQ